MTHEYLKVLDKGFVKLVDCMGDDHAIVEAARVSYDGESKGDEQDKKLINYLLDHKHGTPFEHAVFKFHVKAPIFVARQWFRHRISSYNEISFRYTEVKDEFYVPTEWRKQDNKNKQGSVQAEFDPNSITESLVKHNTTCMDLYHSLLSQGVAREMARMVLPVNLYTQWYWTVNARSLMNFLDLRSESHAQWEIQQYSDTIFTMFQHRLPWTAEAFTKNLQKENYKGIFEN